MIQKAQNVKRVLKSSRAAAHHPPPPTDQNRSAVNLSSCTPRGSKDFSRIPTEFRIVCSLRAAAPQLSSLFFSSSIPQGMRHKLHPPKNAFVFLRPPLGPHRGTDRTRPPHHHQAHGSGLVNQHPSRGLGEHHALGIIIVPCFVDEGNTRASCMHALPVHAL